MQSQGAWEEPRMQSRTDELLREHQERYIGGELPNFNIDLQQLNNNMNNNTDNDRNMSF